jgi:sugar phosphate isomerase/epimerase
MSKILLGFNCNCFTNRYDEPDEWTKICAEMGVRHVMFNIDLIDPYWPWDLQRWLCDRAKEACERHGVKIFSSFGGHHGHQHYLGHPDEVCRRESERFFRNAIRQTAYLGGRSFGTCFSILTVRCDKNPVLRKSIIEDAIQTYHRLAEYAAEQGLSALSYEMTSVPRETCATFAENDYVLEHCSDMAVPMRVCLDMGHRNTNGLPEEADHLAWIRRYGARCDVIDCQQTDLSGSCHWPFTTANNQRGIIRGDEVVKTINESGAGEVLLAFELRTPAYYPHDDKHLDNLRTSVEYWRQWVRE